MTDYDLMVSQLRELTDRESNWVADLANASALLFDSMSDLNWAGFYLVDNDHTDKKSGIEAPRQLVLGPFQGNPACIRIPLCAGVCGAAALQNKVQRVDDVHQFPGHIACDSASNAEIVIPIHKNGKLVGVLDLDSPLKNRFTEEDEAGLKKIVAALEEIAEFTD